MRRATDFFPMILFGSFAVALDELLPVGLVAHIDDGHRREVDPALVGRCLDLVAVFHEDDVGDAGLGGPHGRPHHDLVGALRDGDPLRVLPRPVIDRVDECHGQTP